MWKQVLPSQKGKSKDGKKSETLWERPFPGDTRWLQEGTESLTPDEYDPGDNDHNRTWLQCRSLIQDYTALSQKITKENVTKTRCNQRNSYNTLVFKPNLAKRYRSHNNTMSQITEHKNHL